MRNSVKYNKTKYIDTNSLRSKLLTRRTHEQTNPDIQFDVKSLPSVLFFCSLTEQR